MPNVLVVLRRRARELPQGPGAYLMRDRLGRVIYVGKAKNLRRRVSSYFQGTKRFARKQPKVAAMVDMVREVDFLEAKNEAEALLLEGRLIKEYRPKYNTLLTDDKQFLLVRVEMHADLPRFTLTRNRRDDGSRYYGPFAHAGTLRATLQEMRKRFGVLLGDARPERLEDGRYRLYGDARAELFAGHNEATEEEYAVRVAEACSFLDGKAREWLKEVKEKMAKAAKERDFERAAEWRDLAAALKKTTLGTRKFKRALPVLRAETETGLERLRAALELKDLPRRIECFDVSHISGTFVVASMVSFVDGKPDKRNYRRFKIKTFAGNDDFRAMEEVVGRRYRRLLETGQAFPDLVVIDGGAGQVGAALRALLSMEAEPPALVGLAKREETIVFSDERGELKLERRDPALRLLQRARDEAHRLANLYNAELRSRRIRESVLDDIAGLGPARRDRLLGEFGSIDKLRIATEDELRAVDGIGPKLAAEILRVLQAGRGRGV